jgi:hypothetical protein
MVFVELCSKGEGSRLRSRADHKLDAIRSGFAAGCEARLCLAVRFSRFGARPLVSALGP